MPSTTEHPSTRQSLFAAAKAKTQPELHNRDQHDEFEGIDVIAHRMNILLPYWRVRVRWDVLVMFLVLYNALLVPIEFGFEARPLLSRSPLSLPLAVSTAENTPDTTFSNSLAAWMPSKIIDYGLIFH